MGFLMKTTAADLRVRAEAAEQAAIQADEQAGAARVDAARCLADGNADGARKARQRAIEAANDGDTQRDLAAELHRRAEDAAKVEQLAAYEAMRRDAAKAAAEAERLMRTVLGETAEKMAAAQAAHSAARDKCSRAMSAFSELPEGASATLPPSTFDPFLTNGLFGARFGDLAIWRVAE